jgi:segregation and condensation protein B
MKDEELKELKRILETILYAAGRAVDLETLAKVSGYDENDVSDGLVELKREYDRRETALKIMDGEKGYRMTVRDEYVSYLSKFTYESDMNKSILETLSVIAWKAPILQSEIVGIRNNKAYEHLDFLEGKGFIQRIKLGRTFVIKLTNKFFDYFDVDSEHDLKTIFNARLQKFEEKMANKMKKYNIEEVDMEKSDFETYGKREIIQNNNNNNNNNNNQKKTIQNKENISTEKLNEFGKITEDNEVTHPYKDVKKNIEDIENEQKQKQDDFKNKITNSLKALLNNSNHSLNTENENNNNLSTNNNNEVKNKNNQNQNSQIEKSSIQKKTSSSNLGITKKHKEFLESTKELFTPDNSDEVEKEELEKYKGRKLDYDKIRGDKKLTKFVDDLTDTLVEEDTENNKKN